MPYQLEPRLHHKMRDIRLGASKEIIDAKDIMSLGEQAFAKVRTQKAGTARNKNSVHFSHPNSLPV
jgi:hypothetical protein